MLDGVKSLSYAANMLASRIARERGFDEALLVTPHGRVLEAPTSSLFWVDATALCARRRSTSTSSPRSRAQRLMELLEVEERPVHHATSSLEVDEASSPRPRARSSPVAAIEELEFAGDGRAHAQGRGGASRATQVERMLEEAATAGRSASRGAVAVDLVAHGTRRRGERPRRTEPR